MRIGKLKPGTTYAVQLNSPKKQGFRSAEENLPLPPTVIVFTTLAKGQAIKVPLTQPASAPVKGKIPLRWNVKQNTFARVTTAVRMKIDIKAAPVDPSQGQGQQQTIDQFEKYVFEDVHELVENGKPKRIRRKFLDAYTLTRDPQTRQARKNPMACQGKEAVIEVQPDHSVRVVSPNAIPPQAVREFQSTKFISFLPSRPVAVGEQWEITGQQLQTILSLLNARKGRVALKLVKITKAPAIRSDLAHLEGPIELDLLLDQVPVRMRGRVRVVFALALGLPLQRKIEGKLSLDYRVTEQGTPIRVTGQGQFTAIEETAVKRAE